MEQQEIEFQRQCREICDCHVYLCMSGIVSEFTKFPNAFYDEALNLSLPTQDWEESACESGWEVVPEPEGDKWYFFNTNDEFYWDPDSKESIHQDDIENLEDEIEGLDDNSPDTKTWENLCVSQDIEPYETEVLEFWAVSNWLAHWLKKEGERVETLDGIKIWGRTTSGQAIYMDDVFRNICQDFLERTQGL